MLLAATAALSRSLFAQAVIFPGGLDQFHGPEFSRRGAIGKVQGVKRTEKAG
jgi:hypothetical protein